MTIQINYLDNGTGIEIIESGIVTGEEIIEAHKEIYKDVDLINNSKSIVCGRQNQMDIKFLKVSFLIAIISIVFVFPTISQARSPIYEILSKGSEWTLNVDGDEGILKLLGGRGSRTSDGGWEMTMDVEWHGKQGVLRAQSDNENREQYVIFEVTRKGGFGVKCEGYIARETDKFMSGTSLYRALPADIKGAWYATKRKTYSIYKKKLKLNNN